VDYKKILRFWFEELKPEDRFKKNLELDRLINDQFLEFHNAAINNELFDWRKSPDSALAEIIVLDQFSRNIFRDTPKAFSSDPLALALAQLSLDKGYDKNMSIVEKSFLYMPFMHSESKKIHEIAMKLYSQEGLEFNLEYEIAHKNIIDRFGRYPHRNHILNRSSTAEEILFLKEPNSSF
jgi:uncharacterized protein (DUF924 family)